MKTSFWIQAAAIGATFTLLGAGCSTASSTDTTAETAPTGTTTSAGSATGGGAQTSVEIKADDSIKVTGDLATTATVTITGDGFSPASLSVKKGTTVTFVNKGSTSHWPASDPHPTHIDYPEFDPKHEIKTGASWTFTFDKVGTWRYHDHLNSGEKGVIIVRE